MSPSAPLRIGIVGCGAISGAYFATFERVTSIVAVAVADIDLDRARSVAAERGLRALTVDELVNDPEVDVVLNLTIPAAHAEVCLAAIAAGKHVYTEKPLSATTEEGREVLRAARERGVVVGSAPDTVLGTGIQTARKAIEDGVIGTPVFATASYLSAGPEPWHPNPDFYYAPGGGPLFDMGPYYVTALVTLLGPVASVRGQASRMRDTRVVGSGPRAGALIPVQVDTHVTGILTHVSGALSTIVMSFDAIATKTSVLEVHGDKGSMQVTDPNLFEGDVQVFPGSDWEWETVPPAAGYRDAGRGAGLIDLARSGGGADFRANGELGFHVLDVMESILRSAHTGETVDVLSEVAIPPVVPLQPLDRVDAGAALG